MTKTLTFVSAALSGALFSSCSNYSHAGLDAPLAQRDAAAGVAIGGIAGAIIGHQSGETRNGALLGAALGGVTGYVVGEEKDRRWQERGYSQAQSPPSYSQTTPVPTSPYIPQPWGIPAGSGR